LFTNKPNWLEIEGYEALISQPMQRLGNTEFGEYFDVTAPSEERLDLMIKEASFIATLIQPRTTQMAALASPQAEAPTLHCEYVCLMALQMESFWAILLSKWAKDPSFSVHDLLALEGPDAPHNIHHVPSTSLKYCEHMMQENRGEDKTKYMKDFGKDAVKVLENSSGAMETIVKELKEHAARMRLAADAFSTF
jgi:hypothetical protein